MNKVEQPMNALERFLYAQIVRQDVIIEQLSSIVQHLADKDGVAITSNKVEEEPIKPKRTRKKVVTEDVGNV